MSIPKDINIWYRRLESAEEDAAVSAFINGSRAFVAELLPSIAVQLRGVQVMGLLRGRLGSGLLARCLQTEYVHPSPVQGAKDPAWIKKANLVGVNVRTVGNFWNVVKYSLSLPESQSNIHLLPIWEPGVVASLYGISSRNINPEFFSDELVSLCPHLNTVESHLKAVINLLHALGKTVGMDVIPHTDRYAEIVLANPQHFEWLQRYDLEIVDHSAGLHEKIQEAAMEFLQNFGPAAPELNWPAGAKAFFGEEYGESRRLQVLFGPKEDADLRKNRRSQLVGWLLQRGYEPVPATMAPPYRGLEVDPRAEARTVDHQGRVWREYRLRHPQVMSRVFGPLTRFKFYGRLEDNANWEIDFSHPRKATWAYFQEFYAGVRRTFNFDFMRGDMSHVQMRPGGVPADPVPYYDPHLALCRQIRKEAPYFACFAETFLAAPDYMAYGDELDHLEMAGADATLGDLQSMQVGSREFMQHFRWYLDLLATRQFAPSFTVITGDKDDPRFDKFYLGGNEARVFIALFLTDMPSYMSLGFEQRDRHAKPAANEHYTKLFVFLMDQGPKAVRGPYAWGRQYAFFSRFHRMRLLADRLWPEISGRPVNWLIYPNPAGTHFVIAWQIGGTPYLCVVNLNTQKKVINQKIPLAESGATYQLLFSTHDSAKKKRLSLHGNGKHLQIGSLKAGEGRIYSAEK